MLKSIQGNYKTQQKNKFILKNQGQIPPNLIQVVDFNQRLNTEYKWNEELYALKKMGNTNTQSTQISKLPFCITETDRLPLENSCHEDSNIDVVRPQTQIVNKLRIKVDRKISQKQNHEQVDLPAKNKIKKFYDSKSLNVMTCNLIETEVHIQKSKMVITENQRKKFNQRIIKELQKNHNHDSPQTPSSVYQSHPNSPHQKNNQDGFTQALSQFSKKRQKENKKQKAEITEEDEKGFKPLQKQNSQLVSNFFFNPEVKLRKSIDMNAILQDKRQSMVYTQTAFTRIDLWKLNVPADLSFAPRKRTPGKTDSKMVTKKDPPSRKLNTVQNELNINYPQPLITTKKISLFDDQKQEPKSKNFFKIAKKQMDSNKNESVSQKFHKMQQQIDTDKLKFLMADIIQEIKQYLDDLLLNNDQNIRIYIEEYCLLRFEEFTFLITNFFQFCTSQMIEVVKSAQFSTSNKIRKELLDKIKKFILLNFQSKHIKPHIIDSFEASWNENCNLFLYPKNNVDNIGGQPRIIKMIKNVTALLQNDLIVSFPEMSDYNLILAVTSLLNDQLDDFKKFLDLFLLDKHGDRMHVQEYEFFLAKKNIWYVVRDAKLEPRYKQLIMNKVEYARYYLFSDFDLSSKILRKDLSIELFSKHPIFSSYFIHPEDKGIINDMLDCFYGNLSEDEMVTKMQVRLKHGQFTEQFFEILQEILQKWIPVYKGIQKKRIILYTQDINYKIYRFRAKSKIGISAFQIVKNYFGNVDNFMEKFSIFFKVWIEDLGNNINSTTVKGNKTCSMDFLQLILRLALDDVSCFNSVDVFYALPHFAVNMTTFTYWTQGMKSFLQENGINKEEISHFIQFFIKIVYN